MRRIFTFGFIISSFFVTSFNSFAQTCSTNTPFAVDASYNFNTGLQGFTTPDFTVVANRLASSTVGTGTIKTLTTATLSQPVGGTTISWGFDLGGAASVTGYTVDVVYYNGSFVTIPLCSGGAITGNNLTFSAPAPLAIQGQDFQLVFTFTLSGNTNNIITVDNFTSSAASSPTVLPVKFSSLDAKTINNSVSLKWTVGSEINVTGYEIEKSSDGRNFSKIGFVSATGQSSYSFVDPKASSISYYRIKSVDGDGKYTYSTVTLVKAGKSMIVLKAFPSPFTNNLSVQHATANGSSLISISSEDGRLIKTVIPIAGTQQTDINLSTAAPGLYLIRFAAGNKDVQTLKILKQQ